MPIKNFLSDYAAVMSIVLFSGLSYLPVLDGLEIARLAVPDTFETSTGRPLFIDLTTSIDLVHIFSAIIPAIFLTILLYFDHNVSSLLAQRSEYVRPPSPPHHSHLSYRT